jgi:hypothetical protein
VTHHSDYRNHTSSACVKTVRRKNAVDLVYILYIPKFRYCRYFRPFFEAWNFNIVHIIEHDIRPFTTHLLSPVLSHPKCRIQKPKTREILGVTYHRQNDLDLFCVSVTLHLPALLSKWFLQQNYERISHLSSVPAKVQTVSSRLSPRWSGFNSRSVDVGFVVHKLALEQVSLRLLRISQVRIIPRLLHIQLYVT